MKKLQSVLLSLLLSVSAAAKPNIVFILVDDLGYGDVGFNGSTYYETPTLDALAKESLVLDQAYMYPSCSPSRTAYFTGKQSFRTGVYTVPVLEKGTDQENVFSRWTVGLEHRFFSQELKTVGYRSIHLGKWHVVGPYPTQELNSVFPLTEKLSQPMPGDHSWVEHHRSAEVAPYYPEGRGFLKNVGGTYRGDPALMTGGYKSKVGGYFAPFNNPFIEKKPDDEWMTDRLTDEAIEFMSEHREHPFFINLNYYTVHRPTRARSSESHQKYLNKPGDPETGQGIGKDGKPKDMAAFATMIESLDANVKRIVEFLDESGLRENTVLFFTSDNGQNRSQSVNHRLRGAKGEVYEGGIRVPTFVNRPGHVKPRRNATPVSVLDYFPTFMDLAGIEYSGPLDGVSLSPLFSGGSEAFPERPLFWHLASGWKHGPCSVIRKGRYKMIEFLKDGKRELYDLTDDPKESTNLADTRSAVAKQLGEELSEWRKKNAAPLPPNSILSH